MGSAFVNLLETNDEVLILVDGVIDKRIQDVAFRPGNARIQRGTGLFFPLDPPLGIAIEPPEA